jgi:hypothetical protein
MSWATLNVQIRVELTCPLRAGNSKMTKNLLFQKVFIFSNTQASKDFIKHEKSIHHQY